MLYGMIIIESVGERLRVTLKDGCECQLTPDAGRGEHQLVWCCMQQPTGYRHRRYRHLQVMTNISPPTKRPTLILTRANKIT